MEQPTGMSDRRNAHTYEAAAMQFDSKARATGSPTAREVRIPCPLGTRRHFAPTKGIALGPFLPPTEGMRIFSCLRGEVDQVDALHALDGLFNAAAGFGLLAFLVGHFLLP
jgi:hypothetical protein